MAEPEQPVDASTTIKGETFGAWLKGQRLEKKVPLEEIAAVTKIHIHQLRRLEEGWDNGSIPALAFVRGFAVSYAKHIGLDENEVLQKFNQHSYEFKPRESEVKATPPQTYTSNSGKPLAFGSYGDQKFNFALSHWLSTKRIVYGALVLLGFVLLIFLMKLGRHSNGVVQLAPSQSTLEQVGPQQQQTQVLDKNAQGAESLFTGNPPYELSLIATGDVWLNLKIDDSPMENIKLTKDATRKITFNRKARLTISDPNQLKFTVGDKSYRMPQGSGTDVNLNLPEQSSKLQAKE